MGSHAAQIVDLGIALAPKRLSEVGPSREPRAYQHLSSDSSRSSSERSRPFVRVSWPFFLVSGHFLCLFFHYLEGVER